MALLLIIFVFMLSAFGGFGYGDNPLVWGSAVFIGVIFGAINAAAASGAAIILVPLVLVVMFKGYMPSLGSFVGEGLLAFFVIAFFIMLAGI
ncbi:Uncharacterised protein [Candidatus Norongarragalina meridionalis]|nr:Uncharacterised protein [Candidatus Norongarragalina meridionalis]